MDRDPEYLKSLYKKIKENNLKFLGLINLSEEEAVAEMQRMDDAVYRSLDISVIRFNGGRKTVNNKIKVTSGKSAPTAKPNKYEALLDPATDPGEIDTKYLALRATYFNKLRDLEASPGCTGCAKGKLKRKFLELFRRLDIGQ